MHDEAIAIQESARPVSSGEVRLIAALCVASFLAALNFFATSPFYPEIARDLDTTVPLLGQVTTAMILISTVLGLGVGPIADRYGYRLPLVLGVLAVAVTLAGVGLAQSYSMLLVLSITGGLADALVFGLPLAIAGVSFSGAAQRRAIGWTVGSLSSASIIGTPLLTTVASFTSWRVALLAAGAITLVAAWFVYSSLPPDEQRPAEPFHFREMIHAYVPLIRHRPTLRLYGATLLRAVSWIGLITYLGAYLGDEIGLSTRAVGFVYMASGLGYAFGSVVGSRLNFLSPRALVAISCMVNAAGVAGILSIQAVASVVTMIILTSIAASFAGIALASILAAETPAGTGTTMVLNGSMLNLGSACGALLGGALLSIGDYRLMGAGLPVFAIIAAWLAWNRDADPGVPQGAGAARFQARRVDAGSSRS